MGVYNISTALATKVSNDTFTFTHQHNLFHDHNDIKFTKFKVKDYVSFSFYICLTKDNVLVIVTSHDYLQF